MSKIEGVIFDLDGVLTDTSVFHYRAWKRLADEMGIYFDEDINQKLKGVSRKESLEIILQLSKKTYDEQEKEKYAEIKNAYYLELIASIGPGDLYKGVQELLVDIKKRNLKTVLASASKNAPFIINRLGIEHYFDFIVDVNKIAKGKPDSEIFVKGAEGVQLSPKNCIVVEDSIAGLTGAKSAGMIAVGIGGSELVGYADYVFENTGEVDINLLCTMCEEVAV